MSDEVTKALETYTVSGTLGMPRRALGSTGVRAGSPQLMWRLPSSMARSPTRENRLAPLRAEGFVPNYGPRSQWKTSLNR